VPRASPSTEYSAGIEARRLASGDRASGVAAHWWMHLVRMTEFEIVPRLGSLLPAWERFPSNSSTPHASTIHEYHDVGFSQSVEVDYAITG
jgi:hypothetical protein